MTSSSSPGDPATTGGTNRASRAKGIAKWAAVGVGGAILAGVGGLIFQSLQEAVTEPVQVNVQADPSFFEDERPEWTPYFYYLPRRRTQLPAPPDDCRERRDWAWDEGGSDADETRLKVTLTGARDREVSLDSMSVEVVSRTPLEGGVVAACPTGGATGNIHGLDIDLDAETVKFVEQGEARPARFTFANGDTETFDIYAYQFVEPEIVEWRLVLDIVDGSDREPVTIDDGGEPFRTAGAAVAGKPMFVWDRGHWVRYRP